MFRVALSFVLALSVSLEATPPEDTPLPPRGLGPGALLLVGGGTLPSDVGKRFHERAGGQAARLVLIPTAAHDVPSNYAPENGPQGALWLGKIYGKVTVLHTRSREEAEREEFTEPLREATAVWIGGGQQSRLAEVYAGTRVERELRALLSRGGIVGGTSAGAAIQSREMIEEGQDVPVMARGFDLFPGAVVDQHFLARNRVNRLRGALRERPGTFGIGLGEKTAAFIDGRSLEVLGEGFVCLLQAPSRSGHRELSFEVLRKRDRADIVALARAARARASRTAYPWTERPRIAVSKGTLVIVGGGRLSEEILRRFFDAAGGAAAPFLVVPTAVPGENLTGGYIERALRELGAKDVEVLHSRDPREVRSPEFLARIDGAKGVWFTGGRQWRIVDAYYESPAFAAFHRVLERGGAIGGSSAGATIQGDYLVRGNPLGNTDMMAAGYERGFAFLPGVAIDQHFSERQRHPDLKRVIDRFPQILGLGIDESTAAVVHGTKLEVLGAGSVFVFDRKRRAEPIEVKSGASFTLEAKSAEL